MSPGEERAGTEKKPDTLTFADLDHFHHVNLIYLLARLTRKHTQTLPDVDCTVSGLLKSEHVCLGEYTEEFSLERQMLHEQKGDVTEKR